MDWNFQNDVSFPNGLPAAYSDFGFVGASVSGFGQAASAIASGVGAEGASSGPTVSNNFTNPWIFAVGQPLAAVHLGSFSRSFSVSSTLM